LSCFTEIEKSLLKFTWKHKRPLSSQRNHEKKRNAGGFTIYDLKLYFRIIVAKAASCWHKNKHIEQQNEIEGSEIIPQYYSCLIFDKCVKNMLEKKQPLQQMVIGKLFIYM
jgi:hypothetical protein